MKLKKKYLGFIRYFSATLIRDINRGILFDYSFSKAVENKIIRDFDIHCIITPKVNENNRHNHLLREITKISQKTLPSSLKGCARYLGFCQWSEAERETGRNVLSMVNDFKSCSNGHWIEGITGKDSSKNRQNKLKKFEEDDNDCLLKLLLSCRSLSEGVDLKNIHGCVLFDPRQSAIEIKQIIGRSVRPFRDDNDNVLPWDEQTPSNLILPLQFDLEKIQELEHTVEGQSQYLKDEILNQEYGMFATLINVISVMKEYVPIYQFKFYLRRYKSSNSGNDEDEEELTPVCPEDDLTTTNKIVKKVLISCSDEMLTLLRMNPHKLKNGLMQLEMGLHDKSSLNGFFRKEDFFKKIQDCKDKMNEYIHDVNHLNKRWSRETIMGKDLGNWMNSQISLVNNPDTQGDKFVNQHTQMIVAIKDLDAYELECKKQQYYIGIDHIKKLFNEYIHDVNHLNKRWSGKAIVGKDLSNWMDNQISLVNNPNKNGDTFVNKYPQLIVAVKDLDAYELECKKTAILHRNRPYQKIIQRVYP